MEHSLFCNLEPLITILIEVPSGNVIWVLSGNTEHPNYGFPIELCERGTYKARKTFWENNFGINTQKFPAHEQRYIWTHSSLQETKNCLCHMTFCIIHWHISPQPCDTITNKRNMPYFFSSFYFSYP